MYDFDVKDKKYTGAKKKSIFTFISVSLIVIGAAMIVVGGIYCRSLDLKSYISKDLVEVSEEIDGSEITSVDIEVGAGDIFVGRSEDGQVHLKGKLPSAYEIKESGGKLRLVPGMQLDFNLFGFNKNDIFNFADLKMELYLPDKEYEEFNLDVGAGEITIEGIKCKKVRIDTGAGEVNVDDITCSGMLKADTGAGEIDITNAVTGGLDLDVGAGEIRYAGEVNGDIDADCGVGDCQIDLTNSEEDYSKKYTIKTDVGLGDVKVSYGN